MANKIQVGVSCGTNCEYYTKFLISTIARTISDGTEIEFLFGINKPDVDINFLNKSADGFKTKIIKAFSKRQDATSISHGECLNVILEKMDSAYGMLIDCDIAFLEKDWNQKLIKELKDNIVIVGSEYEGDKYMGFPNIIGCLFLTAKLKEVGIKFDPAVEDVWPFVQFFKPLLGKSSYLSKKMQNRWRLKHLAMDETNYKIFGRNIGDSIGLDTGWELPYKLRKNGCEGKRLKLVKAGDKDEKFTAICPRNTEFQLNGTPIFTHRGRSSFLDFNKDPIVIRWRMAVEGWLSSQGI